MKLRAINRTVIIKPIRTTHKVGGFEVKGGLDNVRFNYGQVVASSIHNEVKAEDMVYYDAAAGSTLLHENTSYIVLDEMGVKAIDD